jgi:uncharacterized protein (TIGR02145 family)
MKLNQFAFSLIVIATFAQLNASAQKTKPSVKIGAQTWATQNLNVSAFRNGEPIPEAESDEEWNNASIEGKPVWCYYNGKDSLKGQINGKLYNWFAVHDSRGLAPKGWHIPGDTEWGTLIHYLGGDTVAGKKMKSTTGWDNKGNGDNSSGFNAFPVGNRDGGGIFMYGGQYGFFWSADEYYNGNAYYSYLFCDDSHAKRHDYGKGYGLSVRCIKDK